MKNYILLTGQIKLPDIFNNVINEYIKLKNNFNISILLVTWKNQKNKFKQTNHFKTIYLNEPKYTGEGNIIAQAIQFRKGLEYIEKDIHDKNNLFILKSRPDVIIKSQFLSKIFKINLKCNSSLFSHKIWTGWAHATKPFYLEDAYFYSHYHTIKKLQYFDNPIFQKSNLGMGISHIRRFIYPFLDQFPILKDYINNKNNLSLHLCESKLDFNNLYLKKLFKTYYQILDKYFFIYLENNNDIIFRTWNQKIYYEINYNDSLQDISKQKFKVNLKLIYNKSLFNPTF